ncbi:MAG: biotin/lipoyl-containing protein [Candidatus Zixiibacteriota bacterium]
MKKVQVTTADKNWAFELNEDKGQLCITNNGVNHQVNLVPLEHNCFSLIIDGRSYTVGVNGSNNGYTVFLGARSEKFAVEDFEIAKVKRKAGIIDEEKDKKVIAPMPGMIVSVACSKGESISRNQPLLIMEAMKMENDIKSPVLGIVKNVSVAAGDNVNKGQVLIEFE